ncbi:HXXEE domain-containing protein [Roseococcus sp. YIM B11640]|uniref:HXXEE domain-containing protein n=1 Tax=Roseococcus sp. YIM B11640 TaxID=3133973 RepID=UPI003C7D96DF
MDGWGWFDLNFPWIGAAAAAVLLALLFGTGLLRADLRKPRWRDPSWLSWMGVVAYLLHNVEEYGIDLLGRRHRFPADFVQALNLPPYPDSPVPPLFFLAVNVTAFWVAAPLAALLSRRHPLVGLSVYGIIIVNFFAHLLPLLGRAEYGAGLLTALTVFLPLSIWTIHACFGPGRMSYRALALLVAGGILVHIILGGSVLLFLHGAIGGTALVLAQVVNPFLLMFILRRGETWRGGTLVSPLPRPA